MHSAMQNDTVSESGEIMGCEDQIPQTNVFHILKKEVMVSVLHQISKKQEHWGFVHKASVEACGKYTLWKPIE